MSRSFPNKKETNGGAILSDLKDYHLMCISCKETALEMDNSFKVSRICITTNTRRIDKNRRKIAKNKSLTSERTVGWRGILRNGRLTNS